MIKKTINIKLIKKLIAACFEAKPIAKDKAIRLLAKSKLERYEIKKENGEISTKPTKLKGGINVKKDIKT